MQLDPTVQNSQEIANSHRIRAKFIDDYRLFTAVTNPTTSLQLWDTATGAQLGSTRFVEFELGPDYYIEDDPEETFYFSLGSNHGAPFHEDHSRQLVGICVYSRVRGSIGSTLLVTRYEDLVKLTFQKPLRVEWDTWRDFVIAIDIESETRGFGLLRSNLLETFPDPNNPGSNSGIILRVYDFAIRSRKREARDRDLFHLPPYTIREFLLSAEEAPLRNFRFMEDGILALAVSNLPIDSKHARPQTPGTQGSGVAGPTSLWMWTV